MGNCSGIFSACNNDPSATNRNEVNSNTDTGHVKQVNQAAMAKAVKINNDQHAAAQAMYQDNMLE
jgi:hypothetical protein